MTVTHVGAKTCHVARVFAFCTYAHAAFYKRFGDETNGPVDCFDAEMQKTGVVDGFETQCARRVSKTLPKSRVI
eukprot:11214249-Lingulodinium_polyedra.AAC.1